MLYPTNITLQLLITNIIIQLSVFDYKTPLARSAFPASPARFAGRF
ncbi:hypothetical protein ECDEC8C_5403 [Escherichia coli DEC8C]|nr:hypothetical protein ECDEC8C_5403 [Escherichia coli DEC8C]ESD11034.1 hypothetical protein HMPREF1595_01010 [Escherichia coli 907672]